MSKYRQCLSMTFEQIAHSFGLRENSVRHIEVDYAEEKVFFTHDDLDAGAVVVKEGEPANGEVVIIKEPEDDE